MNAQNKGQSILRSIFSGVGVAILYLLIGTVLDYVVTQVVSQFFLTACSEDCYFRIFNFLFVVVVLVSLASGLRAGMRSYKRSGGQQ